jgi:hypothetical protein
MPQSVRDTLAKSVNTGEVIRIIYYGGSQPGSVREISPIIVSESEVRALDLATGIMKLFKLSKIEFADGSTSNPAFDPAAPPARDLSGTIRQVLSRNVADLELMGWQVRISDDSISVHRFFKNGKPRKAPDIDLSYAEFTVDMFIELDGTMKEERRKSSRPYCLRSPNFASARTFVNMSNAVSAFLDEASTIAPGLREQST